MSRLGLSDNVLTGTEIPSTEPVASPLLRKSTHLRYCQPSAGGLGLEPVASSSAAPSS